LENDVFIEFEMLLHKGFDPIAEVMRGEGGFSMSANMKMSNIPILVWKNC
jgi:hypothetical protein